MRKSPSINALLRNGARASFQFRNEQFFGRSKKTRDCAEAYKGTPHKQSRRLTQKLRKSAISEWKRGRKGKTDETHDYASNNGLGGPSLC
ncbi:MAG: hypothetical protein MOIL_00367 [Candidatus Methanolliviera sp. GoM_oil]|nr:MAG: hypothetical protein MOIL_00367 [Candidatus Methanolliviera sp. GoM_oil]